MITLTGFAGEHIGWNVTCCHPEHTGGGQRCRFTRKCKTANIIEDQTMLLIQTWLMNGNDLHSRADHAAETQILEADLTKLTPEAAVDPTSHFRLA